ncbi:MAG: nuclease-related domain-containing protein [Nitrospirota bacterium]
MAKVLGETGRYVADRSIKKYQQQFVIIFTVFWVLAFIDGYLLALRKLPIAFILILLFALAAFMSVRWTKRKLKELENERLNFRKGATGEAIIGFVLDNFPDEFRVIHDLTTPYGNVDHVVIGPTGAYIIDTKNWKGVVAADGNGELLLNGKPTQKPEIKNLSRRVMSIKEKLNVLSSLNPYVHGVFAFPSAYIEAKWGTTGYIHCVKDEQLYDYIVENNKGKKLSKKEIETLSQAFLALARMDKGFGQNEK